MLAEMRRQREAEWRRKHGLPDPAPWHSAPGARAAHASSPPDPRALFRTRMARLAAVGAEARARLERGARAKPPAWLWALETCYAEFPSPAMGDAQHARARSSLRRAAQSIVSRTVLRALAEGIRCWHPDKNLASEHGEEWAALSAEVTKLLTSLLAEYRARIEQGDVTA